MSFEIKPNTLNDQIDNLNSSLLNIVQDVAETNTALDQLGQDSSKKILAYYDSSNINNNNNLFINVESGIRKDLLIRWSGMYTSGNNTNCNLYMNNLGSLQEWRFIKKYINGDRSSGGTNVIDFRMGDNSGITFPGDTIRSSGEILIRNAGGNDNNKHFEAKYVAFRSGDGYNFQTGVVKEPTHVTNYWLGSASPSSSSGKIKTLQFSQPNGEYFMFTDTGFLEISTI